jgi:hypothetical protein
MPEEYIIKGVAVRTSKAPEIILTFSRGIFASRALLLIAITANEQIVAV